MRVLCVLSSGCCERVECRTDVDVCLVVDVIERRGLTSDDCM